MLTTTLKRIREVLPDDFGFRKLLGYLGKSEPDDEPVSFLDIRKGVGLSYATHCTLAEPGTNWRPLCSAFADHAESAVMALGKSVGVRFPQANALPLHLRAGDVVGVRVAAEMWTADALRTVRRDFGPQGELTTWHKERIGIFDTFVSKS